MRFPLDFSLMLSRKKRSEPQQGTALPEPQVHDDRTPEQIDTWCKSTSLTKNGDEIMFPNQGDTWHAGETQGFGWTGGIHIDDNQSQTFSLEIRAFGSNDDSQAVQIFANETFHYPSTNWQVWNKECPDTYISYYWKIPKDFKTGDTKFVATLLNTTDPENETTLTSSFFYIDSEPVDVSIEASVATPSTTPAAATTTSIVHNTATAAPTATIEAAASDQTTTVESHGGLSVRQKAGIGAGVGVLGLMLLLAGLLFYYYRKRQNKGISEKGFVTPALGIRTARPRISEGGNSEIQRARVRESEDTPGSPLYRTDTQRNSHRRSIRIVYEPNQDPIGLPADVSMWSPKTSQDELKR
ncbi:hypothetical protein FPOAC1_005832 [Fusarium poae]|uniref:hypothetical protein n=1 Tax=Fusarium poae TaxID=36050 RepID=UPI001CE96D88|nr:hypothetical protein FPOAC1_005832 [Fusarium poae]KAG8672556.1 hypothetical protein FPOAC1_005832 [Fusarium poae]